LNCMRIGINFHSADKYISGVEYSSLGMINALLQINADDQYIIFTNQPDLVNKYVCQIDNLTVYCVAQLKTRIQRIVWEHSVLPKLIKNKGLNLLHCPHYICPFPSSGIPYVVTIHDTIALDHPKWCKITNALYFKLMMGSSIKKASRVIALSQTTADNLKHHFQGVGSKLRVVYPGIDTVFSPVRNYQQAEQVRAKYSLPERYILFVGNIEPKKNISALVEACKLLRTKGLPHKLVMVGKRSWKCKGLWKLIHQEVDVGNIILAGYVERQELPVIYHMADVFVFVSLHEGFGFPPLEAMACGTPVVASSVGVLSEMSEEAAYMVNPIDPQNIAEAIYLLITSSELREKYTALGIKKSREFSWENAAKQIHELYREVVTSHE